MHCRNVWQLAIVGLAALGLVIGATVAPAQDSDEEDENIEDRLIQIAPDKGSKEREVRPYPGEDRLIDVPKHWVGVGVGPVPELLRKHLQLEDEEGVLVLNVVDDSPAAKAGITKDDVIVSAAGKDLVEVRDLLEVVREREGQEFELEVIHEGEQKSVTISPAERPDEFAVVPFRQNAEGLWQNNLPWRLERAWPDGDRLQFRALGPGVLFDSGQLGLENLPSGVSVQVYKENDGPATVKVQKGDEKWEFEADDEEALEELPEDVRGIVQGMLGGHRAAFALPAGPDGGALRRFEWDLGQAGQARNLGEGADEAFEKRMQEIESRIEELVEQLEQLQSEE
jgi:membrane-associated protease RseP (regulator of RpoE activity)